MVAGSPALVDSLPPARLQAAHLTVGYAMSRLDRSFLTELGYRSWQQAYDDAALRLHAKWKSIKGLRDEFDPLHPHTGRKGWHGRAMLADRIRVAAELSQVSDEALLELVRRLLVRTDAEAEDVNEVLDALAPVAGAASSAAERMLTGRLAEEYVMENCQSLLGYPRTALVDCRQSMLGYDFTLDLNPLVVVEVKGLRALKGSPLFTDREWRESRQRRDQYWLAVVGGVASPAPRAQLIINPHAALPARCVYQRTIRASWHASFSMTARYR